MGERMIYPLPPGAEQDMAERAEHEQQARQEEKQREREALIERITASREILDIGFVPSEAEEADFYGQLGVDAHEADILAMLTDATTASAKIALQDFYTVRRYKDPYDWLSSLSPELRRQVEIDGGKAVADQWRAEREIWRRDG